MEPVILFRKSLAEEDEFAAAQKYFQVREARTDVRPNQTVIGRYSVLPYYSELETDIKSLGSQLINTHLQHQMVSDIQNWYSELEHLTPKTWLLLDEVQYSPNGYFLKGQVNSRKQLFRTHSYAEDQKAMLEVYFRLMEDSLISHQGVCIREFVKLKRYGINDITGCPIAKEFRLFVYKGKVFAKGFYWSGQEGFEVPSADEIPEDLIRGVVLRMKDKANFFCFDVAQKEDGNWTLIELGDAQMAGLSCIAPDEFYKGLREAIDGV